MDGIFGKSRFSVLFDILGIIAGIVLMAMLPVFIIVDIIVGDSMTSDTILGLAFFAGLGLIVVLICIASLFLNKGAFLHLDEDGISARFLWKTKLKCNYSEIAFCEYGINTLTVRLKYGKLYIVPNILNAADICGEIRKRITVSDENDYTTAELYDEVCSIKKERKKWIVLTVIFGSMMFLAIAVTVLLTGGKDPSEFSNDDWTVFIIFGNFELIDVIVTFIFANKCGKLNPILNEKRTLLKTLILKTAPLPPGNLLNVYIDTDYNARAIIFGYPNMDDVYFIIQVVDKEYNITTTYSSEVFSSIEELQPMLEELIQIE